MKLKSFTMIALALVLALSLMCTPAFAAPGSDSATTTAKIAFIEGDLEIDDESLGTGIENMNIDFGSNKLPGGATVYTAVDGNHTLRILDGRVAAGGWDVTVQMSPFKNNDPLFSTNVFDGIIKLSSGAATSTSATKGTLTAENSVVINSSTASDAQVLNATTGFSHGTFENKWLKENTELEIDDDAAAATKVDSAYTATLTWTLTWA